MGWSFLVPVGCILISDAYDGMNTCVVHLTTFFFCLLLKIHTMELALEELTCNALDKIHRDFFWKNQTTDKGINMVS